MDPFNWLHLSDLHWGCPGQKHCWPQIRERLFENLGALHEKCGPWHAVFFTGDLVHDGHNFEEMEQQVLHPLWAELKRLGSNPVLVAVPGNHDLKRPTYTPPTPAVRWLTTVGGFHEIADEFWEETNSPYRQAIDEAFADYSAWWKTRPHCVDQAINDGLLPGDFSTTFTTTGGHRVGVLGLNTAFLQLAKGDYQARLACDVRQFHTPCQGDGFAWAKQHDVCLLLTHQGPDWLDKASRETRYPEINPAGCFAIHVFGHMHETAMRSVSSGCGPVMRHWQGMSLFGLEHFCDKNGQEVKRLHGYGAGRLELDEDAVQLRHWPKRAILDTTNGWRFIRDEERCVLEEDGGTREEITLSSQNKRTGPAMAVHSASHASSARRSTTAPSDVSREVVSDNLWSVAATRCALWTSDSVSLSTTTDQFRSDVVGLVAACWCEYHSAVAAMPTNPWWDEQFPLRVLQRLDCLALRVTDPVKLSDAEVSLLVAAPFVREGVLASAVRFCLPFNPLSLEPAVASERLRRILEQAHQSSPTLVRRAGRLKAEGDEADHDAIAAWLMFRALYRSAESWLMAPSGFISPDLQKALAKPAASSSQVLRETFSVTRLLELARCVHADPERIERNDRSAALKRSVSVASSTRDEREVRERLLGYLLCLAGWMAIDVRSLDGVLVEHIGLSDPVVPDRVVSLLTSSAWPLSRGQRVLRAACDHPAVDYALRDHVLRADGVLVRIHRKVHDKEDGLEVLSGLPTRFAGDDITPASLSPERLPYEIPHLRFHLAHDEIRELLMGESLYGDPTAAIRELYQNALDACRYRAARIAYLRQTRPNVPQSWEGRIIFRQGVDETGRPFIECEDNGVGMGRQELDECFARAGCRFVDMPEYIEEQSEWLGCNPPIRLYPNAQFGIGVFSYLLLADELHVESCRFRRDGSLGRRLLARVSGSGGLFRVTEVLDSSAIAGTRVRLYLSKTTWNDQPISCSAKLSELLWVAEFTTEVHTGDDVLVWRPEKLQCRRLKSGEYVSAGNEDVWWSIHNGQILVDGLALGPGQYGFCVANLRGPHRPRLMLNRSAIMPGAGPMAEWDRSFVDRALEQGAQYLRTWPGLTLAWLWRVAQDNWRLAERVLDEICREDHKIPIGNQERGDAVVSLRKVGCFGGDQVILDTLLNMDVSHYESDMCHGMVPEWLVPWRVLLWESEGVRVPERVWRVLQRPDDACSLPRLVPGDSLVLSRSLGQRDWLAGNVPVSHLIRAAAKMEEPITAIMARLERFGSFGLTLPKLHGQEADRFRVEADDIIALSRTCHEGGMCLDDRASAAHIIRVAAKLGRPLHNVMSRFRDYKRLGIELPASAVGDCDLAGIAVRREYLAMLSEDLSDGGASLDDELLPVHLVYIAGKSKRNLAEVIADLAPFAKVGLRMPEVVDSASLEFVPTQDDLLAMSQCLDGQTPMADRTISPSRIVRIAFRLKKPVAVVLADLKRFAPLGVRMPDIDLSCVGDLTVTFEDAIAMCQGRRNWGLSIGDRVPPAHLFLVSSELSEPLLNTFRRLSRFQCLGLQLPNVDLPKAGSIRKLTPEDVAALSCNCDGLWPWLNEIVTRDHILRVAQAIYESPEEIVERLRSFECLGLRIPSGQWGEWDQ